jgi:hypothetical protein
LNRQWLVGFRTGVGAVAVFMLGPLLPNVSPSKVLLATYDGAVPVDVGVYVILPGNRVIGN